MTARRPEPGKRPLTLCALCVATVVGLAACSNDVQMVRPDAPTDNSPAERWRQDPARGSIFGEGGLTAALFGGPENEAEEGGSGIGVNSFLWRASLDTLSFMPVVSADPFGGVILTDWYSLPESPNERFKINLYILDRQLRADGIRASVFRQVLGPDGEWVDAPVGPGTATAMEDTILTRARELRVAAVQ